MNLSSLVGPVDVYAATVLVAFCVGCAVVITVALVRPPRIKLDHDFRLAELTEKHKHEQQTQSNDIVRERDLAKIASSREVEFKRIDSGMIDLKVSRSGGDGEG